MEKNVRLVAHTEPNEELKNNGITNLEEYIAYVARVSNPDNQYNSETSGRLLQYLIRNKHWSPFEMASATLEIKTTRDIGRQILRHRSFSFQEFSGRYSTYSGFIVDREARLQDSKNRQNSIETDDPDLQKWFRNCQEQLIYDASQVYEEALEKGIAKEQARAILPEGLTPTTLYMAGTIRSWIHYCAERTKSGVQKEHRNIALLCQDVLSTLVPSISEIIKNQQE